MGAMAVATGLPQVCPAKSCKPGKSHNVTDDKLWGGEAHDNQDVEELEEVEGLSSEWWGFQTPMHRSAVEEKHAPIHGVPDDVMTLIFSRLPRQSLANARVVCSSWKRMAEHQELAALRRQIGVGESWIYVLAETPEESAFRAYDPIADRWSVLPPTPGRNSDEQWQGFSCVAVGHKLLLIGGTRVHKSPISDRFSSGVVCSDVVVYNALTNKWSKAANMTTARSWFAAAVVGTKVYVAGGQGNTKFLDTAEVYDSETDQWEPIASMGNRRSSCHGVCLDGQFWVIAGEYVKNHYDNNQRSSAEVYDAETDTWRFIPNMCIDDNKVLGPSATVNGELVCVHQRKVMVYNKDLNTWTQLGHINGGEVYSRPYSRFGFVCECIGSSLYVIGGTREYMQHRRYCTPLNTVEICDLDGTKQQTSQIWWKLGADMGHCRGTMSASTVLSL